MIIAGTGHRENKIGQYKSQIKIEIRKHLKDLNATKIISGMANGFDLWLTEIAIEETIPFIAAVPFDNHVPITEPAKTYYSSLINKASQVVIVSIGAYASWKYQKRNEYMVDNSNHLLACWNGENSGTKNCIDYAKNVGRDISYIQLVRY